MAVESISLAYRDGGSDKVYHAQIEKFEDGFVVNFQYGRRGSTLQTGTKTSSPVGFEAAKKTFDKIVKEKQAKGYTTSEDGTPFAGTDKAGEVSGLVPQLLNPIDNPQAYIDDDGWFLQEKMDGVHLMVKYENGIVIGSNRRGLIIPLPATIEQEIPKLLPPDGIVDGEAIGDNYFIFDILQFGRDDLRHEGARRRYYTVCEMLEALGSQHLFNVRTALNFSSKAALFNVIRGGRGEGVVFKKNDAPYVPGRPNSGGSMLKFKFKASATCWVIAQNGTKRSVQLAVEDQDCMDPKMFTQRAIGNVTVPANFDIPREGYLCEVEYLYAYPNGSLYQPVYKGVRTDLIHADRYDSLKFKQGTTEEEEA